MTEPTEAFAPGSDTDRYTAVRELTADDIVEKALTLIRDRFKRGEYLASPSVVRQYLQVELAPLEQEVFACIFLDNRHRVISFDKLFFGTIDGAAVHPREIARRCLQYSAAAVILAHNHPSGVAEPSDADERVTSKIARTLNLLDVRVLDHVVVGAECTVSFAERGLL